VRFSCPLLCLGHANLTLVELITSLSRLVYYFSSRKLQRKTEENKVKLDGKKNEKKLKNGEQVQKQKSG